MDLEALRELLRNWVDDENGTYFSNTIVDRFLNMALIEVQKILLQAYENRWVKVVTTTLVADQDRYLLPEDFMKMNRLEVVASGSGSNEDVSKVYFTTLSQKDRQISKTGLPNQYMFLDDEILLRPIPDTARTMRMYYTYRVPELSGLTDIPDIPREYHEYIALRGAKFAFIKDGRQVQELDVELLRYREDMKKDAENRNVDRARDIVRTTTDGIDPLY